MQTIRWGFLGLLMLAGCDSSSECTFNSECAAGSHCAMGVCTTECGPETPCPSGQACTSFGMCVAADAAGELDAGGPRDAGTQVDAGGPRDAGLDAGGALDAGDECSGAECCGNSTVDLGEDCDDGNEIAADGCEPGTCQFSCESDPECAAGVDACGGASTCVAHVCVRAAPPPVGATCSTSAVSAGVCRLGTCRARCAPDAAFGTPVPLTELNSAGYDANATLSPDELTVYLSSDRADGAGMLDMYVATRTTPSAPFGAPTPLLNVNTAAWEGWGSLTGDGLFIYATTIDSAGAAIVGAERASASVPFGVMTPIAALNDASSIAGQPFVLPNHSAVYFGTTRGGNYDLYRAGRTSAGFGAPTPVSSVDINGPEVEHVVALTPDELTIYFVSRRDGGDDDIYVASRASVADGFGAAVALSALNTDGNDFPTWIAPDGCQLIYGASNDLFVATRTP